MSTVDHAERELGGALGGDDTVVVIVPVVRQGVLDWLANDQRAFAAAEETARETADRLPADVVRAAAGEADVGLAIADALAEFPADEIVVAVRPSEERGLVEAIATEDAPPRTYDGVPVRLVVTASG